MAVSVVWTLQRSKGMFDGVKWSHVAILVMMVGGAAIPFIAMAGSAIASHLPSVPAPNLAPFMASLGKVRNHKT